MTNKERKRKIFSSVIMALLIIGIIFITYSGVQKWIGIGFFALALILLIINSLGTFYYSKASKMLNSDEKKITQALPIFQKAVKLGVDAKAEVVVATLLVQYGNKEEGRKLLEEETISSDVKVGNTSKISLSMYYWITKDLDKAISIIEDVYNTGYRDRNLYINLTTYYLEKGQYKEFKKLIKESKDKGMSVPATLDLEASYSIVQSDWARCGNLLEKLFKMTTPHFIDPYLHKAMLLLHYGEWNEAVKTLKEIKTKCIFNNASIYSEAQIDLFIAYIENSTTRWGFLDVVNNNPTVFIKREMPKVNEGLTMPSFPPKPDFSLLEETKDEIEEKDEGDIDTSLTEDDEDWIKKHS